MTTKTDIDEIDALLPRFALQDALDDYVEAAIDYRAADREYRSSRERDERQVVLLAALDALITARVRELVRVG
jgi:hypothetical protein